MSRTLAAATFGAGVLACGCTVEAPGEGLPHAGANANAGSAMAGRGAAGSAGPGAGTGGNTSVAVGGRASAGSSSSAPGAGDQEACAPVAVALPTATELYREITDCSESDIAITSDSHIHNAKEAWIHYLDLDTPMPAGQTSAISLRTNYGGTPRNVEIWGSEVAGCGPVSELLWWSPDESRRLCAQFVPSKTVNALAFVWRRVREGSEFGFKTEDISLCPSGSCPGARAGMGLVPGETLDAPVGIYELFGAGLPRSSGIANVLGGYGAGAVIARYGDGRRSSDDPYPLADGMFRTPPYDPFGDRWYCLGPSSTLIRRDRPKLSEFHLRELTALPACEGHHGSDTVMIEASSRVAQLTASNAAFTLADAEFYGSCDRRRCAFNFSLATDSVMTQRNVHLVLHAAGDLGTSGEPTLATTPVVDAVLILVPPNGGAMQQVCANGGSITWNPNGTAANGTTTIALSGLGDAITCPGEPVTPNSLDLLLD